MGLGSDGLRWHPRVRRPRTGYHLAKRAPRSVPRSGLRGSVAWLSRTTCFRTMPRTERTGEARARDSELSNGSHTLLTIANHSPSASSKSSREISRNLVLFSAHASEPKRARKNRHRCSLCASAAVASVQLRVSERGNFCANDAYRLAAIASQVFAAGRCAEGWVRWPALVLAHSNSTKTERFSLDLRECRDARVAQRAPLLEACSRHRRSV